MNLAALIPAEYRVAASALALVLLLAGAGLFVRHHDAKVYAAGAESVRAEYRAASEKAARDSAATTIRRVDGAIQIDAKAVAALRANADSAAARRIDGDGLRLALADRRQSAAGADAGQCGLERAYARRLEDVLDASSRLAEEGAGIVEQALVKIDGLQARERVP